MKTNREKINKVHLLFEQSGHFKNVLKEFGIKAEDYDILNDFGETDHVIDLFSEIEKCFAGGGSLFDNISQDDLIIAFFPCVRFSEQFILQYRCVASQLLKYKPIDKCKKAMQYMDELHQFMALLNKLTYIALDRNLKLIIENPFGHQHFLVRYWWCMPKIIDKNRWLHGDYYEKPTQYWFINCEPKNNKIKDPERQEKKIVERCNKVDRSMIHPNYIRWWIQSYILDSDVIEEEQKQKSIFDYL